MAIFSSLHNVVVKWCNLKVRLPLSYPVDHFKRGLFVRSINRYENTKFTAGVIFSNFHSSVSSTTSHAFRCLSVLCGKQTIVLYIEFRLSLQDNTHGYIESYFFMPRNSN